MKVFELMHILKDLPASMEVRAMVLEGSSVGSIMHHEVDGIDSTGLLTLFFEDEDNEEEEEKIL